MVAGTQYLNVMSFFPLFVEQHYDLYISTSMVSICMSCFEIGGIISSPIIGSTIQKIGRKNALIIGFIIMSLSNFGLGALKYIEFTEWKTFYGMSCVTRFVQGIGDAIVITTTFSMVGSNFTDEKEKYFGYLEASVGFGLVVGPPLGSAMYGSMGYAWAFYLTGVISLLAAVVTVLIVSPKLNIDPESAAQRRNNQVDLHNSEVDGIQNKDTKIES